MGRTNLIGAADRPGDRELAKELLQRVEDVPEQVIDLLVERSEGVPYFTEEMVNWLIDHGILDTRGDNGLCLPEKLKSSRCAWTTLQHLLLTPAEARFHRQSARFAARGNLRQAFLGWWRERPGHIRWGGDGWAPAARAASWELQPESMVPG